MHFQRSRFLPWISAACLGAALLAGAAWAGTAEGVRAYDRGQFALAAKELQPAAQAGDPEAQFHLGLMHDFGKGVQLDHAKGRRAVPQSRRTRPCRCAITTWPFRSDDGEGVPQDFKQAVYWYAQAANQGLARPSTTWAFRYDKGEGVAKDHQMAAQWYRKAADQGDSDAQYNLGVAYDEGEGVPQDHQQAVAWYRKAAAQNHVRAQFNLAVSYDDGEGVAQDKKQAVHWYTKAAEQGDADAQQNLGSSCKMRMREGGSRCGQVPLLADATSARRLIRKGLKEGNAAR